MGKTVKDVNFKGTFNNWCLGPIDNAMACIFYGPGFYPCRREIFFWSFCFVFPWPLFGTVSGNKRIFFLADNSQKVVTSMERYILHIFSFLPFAYSEIEFSCFVFG